MGVAVDSRDWGFLQVLVNVTSIQFNNVAKQGHGDARLTLSHIHLIIKAIPTYSRFWIDLIVFLAPNPTPRVGAIKEGKIQFGFEKGTMILVSHFPLNHISILILRFNIHQQVIGFTLLDINMINRWWSEYTFIQFIPFSTRLLFLICLKA